MRVVELEARHVRIPMRRKITHATHSRTETDNLVVRCVLEDHTEGFGEGVPREYVTGETIDSAIALLQRSDLASQLEPCRVALQERAQVHAVRGGCRKQRLSTRFVHERRGHARGLASLTRKAEGGAQRASSYSVTTTSRPR